MHKIRGWLEGKERRDNSNTNNIGPKVEGPLWDSGILSLFAFFIVVVVIVVDCRFCGLLMVVLVEMH